ncbi:hypothetical protein MNBD_GAMMA21-2227 [hydrothermal vent metagenome]|uniref:Transmembrane protein n=1 Tax=hydrothermal vent metagenome TaxID=652676 RepID=A0A3B0ZRC0_9ZZZZ
MSDIYQPPQSDLEKAPSGEQIGGSIENGLAGNYQFNFGEVFSEAWQLTSGFKGTFWLAVLIFFAIYIGISIVAAIITSLLGTLIPSLEFAIFFEVIVNLILSFIIMPIQMGLFIIGIRRAMGESSEASSIMSHYSKIIPLFLTYLLMMVMVLLGLLLLVLPGIYLMMAYYFALPLVAEKGMSPWQALETSRKTITHRWFSFFFFGIIVSLIALVATLPLMIGLIWAMPMLLIAYAIIYRNMFGINKETLA